jgi:regulator of protease activity HflC (stomatin/prohibitin superfamily)
MIDQLLAYIAIFAWAWFVLVVSLITVRAFQTGGLRDAVRAFLSLRVMLAFVVALFLSLLSASLVFIEPQEVGVVVSVIPPNGYREQPLRSGLHLLVPLAERVTRYPVYWQTYTMSKEPSEGSKTGDDSISSRTSDGQIVYLDSSVIYRIDANDAVRLHIELQDRYVDQFIRPVMRGIIRTEVSQFTADEVNSSKRKDLESSLEESLREAFSEKGFVLDRFLLRDISFSPEYASAVEAKQVAEQNRIQREYQAEQIRTLAEAERDRQKLEADGRAAAIQIEAQAQATSIVVKSQAEAKAVEVVRQALQGDQSILQYRYIDKLASNMKVMLLPSNSPFLLPLPDLGLGTEATNTTNSTLYTGTLTNTLNVAPVLTTPTPTPTPTPAP